MKGKKSLSKEFEWQDRLPQNEKAVVTPALQPDVTIVRTGAESGIEEGKCQQLTSKVIHGKVVAWNCSERQQQSHRFSFYRHKLGLAVSGNRLRLKVCSKAIKARFSTSFVGWRGGKILS